MSANSVGHPDEALLCALLNGTPRTGDGDAAHWPARESELLLAAERSRVPVTPLSERRPTLTVEESYRIQWITAAHKVAQGRRIVGHKVGLTSKAMQQQVGIDQPDSGVVLDDMLVPDGGTVRLAELLDPRIEAEIGFRLDRDLHGPETDADAARAAVASVFLAFEIIDTRFTHWKVTLADSIADNAACARIVVGDSVPLAPDWTLPAERIGVQVDGRTVAAGEGRDVLGDPINSVVWVARRLSAYGGGLRAGDIVLAGAVHASIDMTAGTTVRATAEHLPAIHLLIQGAA